LQVRRRTLIVRGIERGDARQPRNDSLQQFDAFRVNLGSQAFDAGHVAGRVRHAGHETCGECAVRSPDDVGIVLVACLAAKALTLVKATMTSTLRCTRSAAIS